MAKEDMGKKVNEYTQRASQAESIIYMKSYDVSEQQQLYCKTCIQVLNLMCYLELQGPTTTKTS